MRTTLAALILTALATPVLAQRNPGTINDGPKLDLSLGYDRTQANAPPGICQCFGTNGGYAAGSFFLKRRLAVEAQFTAGVSSDIGSLGQGLHLFTYLAGPKIVYPIRRLTPFVHALVGGASATDSYFPSGNSSTTSASSFAFAGGGGVDFSLTPRISIRAIQAQYLRTTFPNGVSNVQNHLQIGAGIVLKIGDHKLPVAAPTPPPPPLPPMPPPPALEMTCSADVTSVPAGQIVAITGNTNRNSMGIVYTWSVSGGHLLGEGSHVTVDTTNLPAGNYVVTGRAAGESDASTNASCNVGFAVLAPPPPPPPPAPAPAAPQKLSPEEFHKHVLDIYFDYNKAIIHDDALATIQSNAEYIISKPWLVVTIGGFADQRGSSQYNLVLGKRRSQAVKDQLIKDGVPPEQVMVVTYGRDVQRCTDNNEDCWRQNRRASFQMKP